MITLTRETMYYGALIFIGLSFIYLIASYSYEEPFVVLPGELTQGTCLSTCAGDSQCQMVLYNPNTRKCSASQAFELPDKDEEGYRKLDLKKFPNTFITLGTEKRINVDEIGAGGEGLPIDWTQDTNVDPKLDDQQTEILVQDRERQRRLEDAELGFSDLDTIYHGTLPEHMTNVGYDCRDVYDNLNALNWLKDKSRIMTKPANSYDKLPGGLYNPKFINVNKKKICYSNKNMKDCLKSAKNMEGTKSVTWNTDNTCCLKF